MSIDLRPLTDEDATASAALGRVAFGMPADPAAPPRSPVVPGRSSVGAFDGDVLAARAMDWHFDAWFGGARIPTAGIAGVAVAPEYRGRGLLGPVFRQLLAGARERGALVSGLYPTATGIYRGLGYEVVTSLDTVRLRTDSLARLAGAGAAPGTAGTAEPLVTRRATAADQDQVEAVYERWARRHNAALARDTAALRHDPSEFLAEYDGLSVAERGGTVVGYVGWDRGPGYDESATLAVGDLVADDADGYRALLRLLSSFATTTPNLTLQTSGDDAVRLLLRTADWTLTARHPYMLTLLDVAGALSARAFPAWVSTRLEFTLAGDVVGGSVGGSVGGYTLVVEEGHSSCVRTDRATGAAFSPQGLAALFAGAQGCGDLRTVGLVSGSAADDPTWDLLFAGPRPQLRDYF